MYRLNISFMVEPHAHLAWLAAVRGVLLPILRREGYTDLVLSRVLHGQAEGHYTFSLLVGVESMERYHRLAGPLWQEHLAASGMAPEQGIVWFMSLMKELDDE